MYLKYTLDFSEDLFLYTIVIIFSTRQTALKGIHRRLMRYPRSLSKNLWPKVKQDKGWKKKRNLICRPPRFRPSTTLTANFCISPNNYLSYSTKTEFNLWKNIMQGSNPMYSICWQCYPQGVQLPVKINCPQHSFLGAPKSSFRKHASVEL